MAFRFGGFRFGGSNSGPPALPALSSMQKWAPLIEYLAPDVDRRLDELKDLSLAKSVHARDPMTKFISTFDMFGVYNGVRDRTMLTALSYETMRRMARQCPPIAAIIQTRCNQVAAFAQRPESRTDSGFKIVMRDREAKPSAADKKEIKRLEDAMENCGLVAADPVLREHGLEHYFRMLVRDTLTMDVMATEKRPGVNRKRYPCVRWQAVDGAEIRLTEPDVYRHDAMVERGASGPILYVQWRDGRVQAEYTDDELAYGMRNPTTDRMALGYGISEMEMLVDIISSILFALNYNKSYFLQSSVPPGVFSVVGDVGDEVLEAFRRQWEAQVKGAANHWRTPIISMREGAGIQYVPFRQSSRDMEYHQWLSFLTAIACAVFQTHPEEINFQAYSPMMRAPMSEASPVSRLKHSQDKGLVPLLKQIAAYINHNIIWRINPDVMLVFQNLTEFDEAADLQLGTQRTTFLSTVNEERIERDLPEFKEWWADIPLNPLIFNAVQQDKMMEQQQQMGMGEGDQTDQGDEDLEAQFQNQGGGQEVGDQRQLMLQQMMEQGTGKPGGGAPPPGGGRPKVAQRSLPMGKALGIAPAQGALTVLQLDLPVRAKADLWANGIRSFDDLAGASAEDLALISADMPTIVKSLLSISEDTGNGTEE